MALPRSRLVDALRLPQDVPLGLGIFRAHGDVDDPIRILVLLATHLAAVLDTEPGACLDPKTRWRDRLGELERLLVVARRRVKQHYAALIDIDALAAPAAEDGDVFAARMRSDLLGVVQREIERGGWILLRPSPEPRISESLDTTEMDVDNQADAAFGFLKADARPLARWLIAERHLDAADMDEILESVRAPEDYLASLVYEALGSQERYAARQVSVLRTPARVNGAYGPLQWAEQASVAPISRESISRLRATGMLYAGDPKSIDDVEMPRRIRHLVGQQAEALEPDARRGLHRWVATELQLRRDPGPSIEAHYHAVRALDVDLAKTTARYHGFDLRVMATSLSRDNRDYAAAASLFEHVARNFEEEDPYPWEYLAYNLARSDSEGRNSGRHETKILEGYERAHRLAQHNPLYQGRWLGYRAERGQNIEGEFNTGMAKYISIHGIDADSVSKFARPILQGLQRSNRPHVGAQLVERWRSVLEERAPRVLEHHGT